MSGTGADRQDLIERAMSRLNGAENSRAGQAAGREVVNGKVPGKEPGNVNGQVPPPEDSVVAQNADGFVIGQVRGNPDRTEVGWLRDDAATGDRVPGNSALKLDLRRIKAKEYLKPNGQSSPLQEAFRRIKRPLLANAYGLGVKALPNGRRIQVTSAVPGEGKTFNAIHLALSIATGLDSSVILVDADTVRPSVMSSLGLPAKPGITDWFNADAPDITDLVYQTNIERLRIMPAGTATADSVKVLGSRRIGQLFDQLSRIYPDDIIVVDSPPLLAASETRSLASFMGQILVVVGGGTTSRGQIDEALALLSKDQSVSMILNRSTRASAYSSYGY